MSNRAWLISPREWADLYEERRFDYAEGTHDAKRYVARIERGDWLPATYFGGEHTEPVNAEREAAQDAAADAAFALRKARLSQPAKPARKHPYVKPIPFAQRTLEWRASHSRFRCVDRPVFTWEEIQSLPLDPRDRAKHPIAVALDMASLRIKCSVCNRTAQIDVDTFKLKHQTKADKTRVPSWKQAA